VKAFEAAGRPASLPVTQEMTDSYIASLNLASPPPGSVQAYSNCGYYLLGRVVARLRGTEWPIQAYHGHLFKPLGITRIRSAVDLLTAQPVDEARYQSGMTVDPSGFHKPDLRVYPSVQTPDQPLVASGHGDYELAVTQSAGGLSAATTDLARLVAIMIDKHDNPALKRATIKDMLCRAAALGPTPSPLRSGYGLDHVDSLGGERVSRPKRRTDKRCGQRFSVQR